MSSTLEDEKPLISKRMLKKAIKVNPDGVIRLAKFLKLNIQGMKMKQIVILIYWRIAREYKRKRVMNNPAWAW